MSDGKAQAYSSKSSDPDRQITELNQSILTLQRRAEIKRLTENNNGQSKKGSLTQEFFEGVKIV